MTEMEIGFVIHYFGHIGVAAIQLTNGELALGDTIRLKGHTSDFICRVEAMQVEHRDVPTAKKGDGIGIKVPQPVREHDKVFMVTP